MLNGRRAGECEVDMSAARKSEVSWLVQIWTRYSFDALAVDYKISVSQRSKADEYALEENPLPASIFLGV